MAVTSFTPFMKSGNTCAIAANATAPASVQLVGDTAATPMTWSQYRIHNNGAQTAFYAYAATNTAADAAAVIPTNASVGAGSVPLPAGAVEVITAPVGQFWSAITASNFAGAAIFITKGIGV